jgi:aspartate aminotransferase
MPSGAFYLFLDFSPLAGRLAERGIHTSVALCERLLLDTGVAILPGAPFGRPAAELSARLSFVDFDGGLALERSLARAGEPDGAERVVAEVCARLVRGIEALGDWAKV